MNNKFNSRRSIAAILCCIMIAVLFTGCQNGDAQKENSGTSQSTQDPSQNAAESESSAETTNAVPGGKYQKSLQKYTTKLEAQMAQDGVPGASVSVTENGETIYSKGFGYADLQEKIPVDPDTLFFSGSVGKVYCTAAALKLLQDEGIALDDPVTKHLPEFQMDDPRYKDITLRMLLNHSAGLPSDVDATQLSSGSLLPEELALDVMEELKGQMLRSNPGDYAVYSNLGFQIMYMVFEKISGQTFGEYLKQNFFEPLNLQNTYMAASENKDVAPHRFALPADRQGRTLPREYSSRSLEGTGGIVSSTEDLCKFIDGILSPDSGVLNAESIALLREDQSLTAKFPGEQALNGLGWDQICRTIPETPVYEKTGGSTHCSTDVMTAPDAGITIAVSFQQQLNPFVYQETIHLMRDILTEKGVIAQAEKMTDYPAQADANAEDSKYAGTYNGGDGVHDLDSLYKADIRGNEMQYSRFNGIEWELLGTYTRRDDDSYGFYDEQEMKYTAYAFQTVGEDTYMMKRELTSTYDCTTAITKKIAAKPSSEAWDALNNSLWLRTNIWPTDYQASACLTMLQTSPEYPGYVVMNGMLPLMEIKSDTRLSNTANQVSGSGYGDVTLADNQLSWLGMKFIRAEEVPELPAENTTVTFEKARLVQWYFVPQDTIINIDVPYDTVRILALSPELAQFYDNIVDSGEFTVPAGSYIGMTSAAPMDLDMGIIPVQ